MTLPNSFQSAFLLGRPPTSIPRDPERPMRILVLADFAGCDAGAGGTPLAQRKIQCVDIDNFDELLGKKRPTTQVPLAGGQSGVRAEIEIGELDDFHPDNLYRKLPLFHELVNLRKRLQDPKTFPQAAENLRESLPSLADSSPSESSAESTANLAKSQKNESDAATLDRVLGASAKGDASIAHSIPGSPSEIDIQSMIDGIVAPYILPKTDPRQAEYIECVDAAVAGQLRSILHDPAFQSLESVWRGLHFLVSQAETCEELQVYIWDVTKAELQAAGETESGQIEDSLLFKRLVTDRDQEPWAMLVTDLSFGKQVDDLILLSRLGAVAANSGGPIIASADPNLLGCQTWTDEIGTSSSETNADAENWQTLRSSPVAAWIGLAGPRFLLRMPYGAATDPIESFSFEEIDDPKTDHQSLLWGAPSIFSATLIAISFLENQWAMTINDTLELDDFPALIFDDDGEKQLKACAEVYIPERIAESFLESGVMPLLSFKNRNAIRLLRFQSIADPPCSLSGSWRKV